MPSVDLHPGSMPRPACRIHACRYGIHKQLMDVVLGGFRGRGGAALFFGHCRPGCRALYQFSAWSLPVGVQSGPRDLLSPCSTTQGLTSGSTVQQYFLLWACWSLRGSHQPCWVGFVFAPYPGNPAMVVMGPALNH